MKEENKINLVIYLTIGFIVFIVIGVIFTIWFPTLHKIDKNTINSYEIGNYEQELRKYYTSFLTQNLEIDNFDELYEKIDKEYLTEIGLSEKNDVKNYLKDNNFIGLKFMIDKLDFYQNDNKNIIVVSYYVKNEQKFLYIHEKVPYNFKISFNNNYNVSDNLKKINLHKVIENIDYNLEVVSSRSNNITLKLTITNNSVRDIEYDFSYLDSVQLLYGDGEAINISSIANATSDNGILSPESSVSREFMFNLPFENQLSINGANINNLKVNGENFKVKI